MKIKVKRTGQVIDVIEARAKYWARIGYATLVDEEPEKKAVKKEKITKPAKQKNNGNTKAGKGTSKN